MHFAVPSKIVYWHHWRSQRGPEGPRPQPLRKKYQICYHQICFSNPKLTKTRFQPGLRRGPGWGSLWRSHTPYSRLTRISNSSSPFVLSSSRCTKIRFRPGLRPGPRWEAYDAPTDPLVSWGGEGDTPSPFPSHSHPLASRTRPVLRPLNTKSWLRQ